MHTDMDTIQDRDAFAREICDEIAFVLEWNDREEIARMREEFVLAINPKTLEMGIDQRSCHGGDAEGEWELYDLCYLIREVENWEYEVDTDAIEELAAGYFFVR